MKPSVHELLKLALGGGYVFHGSPASFEVLEPSRTRRVDADGLTVYDEVSAHATPLLGCALNYVGRARVKGKENRYTNGVSLRSVPVRTIFVLGPKDREDAIGHLFGRGGYLCAFRESQFERAEDVGPCGPRAQGATYKG